MLLHNITLLWQIILYHYVLVEFLRINLFAIKAISIQYILT